MANNNDGKMSGNSVAVLRVSNLSGGNYWGIKSVSGIAGSIKEMLGESSCKYGAFPGSGKLGFYHICWCFANNNYLQNGLK